MQRCCCHYNIINSGEQLAVWERVETRENLLYCSIKKNFDRHILIQKQFYLLSDLIKWADLRIISDS